MNKDQLTAPRPEQTPQAEPGFGRALVFGATGSIGRAICTKFSGLGGTVVAVARTPENTADHPATSWVAGRDVEGAVDEAVSLGGGFDAVCWAQGMNGADSAYDFDEDRHMQMYEANCLYTLRSLRRLLKIGGLASAGARMTVVSSIWQERARQDRLSYCITKAAVGGLVRSASIDLAADGHRINAVLPGALDTPMTRANVAPAQIEALSASTPFKRLTDLETVAELVGFLCGPRNLSLTGQSIAIDLGFSNVRIL